MGNFNRYYISDILRDVCGRMGDVTGAIFVDHRPKIVSDSLSEMIVVSIPGRLNDLNAWQKGTLTIEMMVRNIGNGMSNIPRLDAMLNIVTSRFPISTPRYSASSPRLILKGDDDLGFTTWVISASLIVNTTDNFNIKD